jgi:type IV pilus assembly protein PilA
MKADIKYKLLQHLNQKNKEKEEGFTLIELLVVIIIIGILAAIALPSFLNQANKAKQTEAKQTLSAMNKSQQAYYTENSTFISTNIADFQKFSGAGIKTATVNYTYDVTAGGTTGVVNLAKPGTTAALLGYAGGVGLVTPPTGGDSTSTTTLCQSEKSMSAGGAQPTAASVTITPTDVKCPGGGYVDAK